MRAIAPTLLLFLVACQPAEPLPEVSRFEELGALPLPSSRIAGRDGAGSGVIGGRLLWTFGDTFSAEKNPVDGSNVWSATAGWATVERPFELEHAVEDGGLPTQFIPYTAEEIAQNRADPLNGVALWPLEVFDTGAAEALVTFVIIRRENGSGFHSVGVGSSRVAPGAYTAVRGPDLFLPPELPYGAGGSAVVDGFAYLFHCEGTGFVRMGCRMARAELARAGERAAYTFYDGSRWQPDIARAAIAIDGVGGVLTVTFNPYLKKYLAVTNGLLHSSIVLKTARAIEGPWQAEGTKLEELLPAEEGAHDYLAREHVALRGGGGESVVISYSRPLGNFRGEVRLVRVTFR